MKDFSRVIIVLLLCNVAGFHLTARGQAQSADASIQSVVERFFDAYRSEDRKRLAAVWSKRARPWTENEVLNRSGSPNKNELKRVEVVRVEEEGDKARVRVAMEASAGGPENGSGPAGSSRTNWTVSLVKERGEWKIWVIVVSEKELASRIAAAKTDEERVALTQRNEDLVNRNLDTFLLAEDRKVLDAKIYPLAGDLFKFTAKLATRTGDKHTLAICFGNIARCYEANDSYAEALDYMKKTVEIARQLSIPGLLSHALMEAGFEEMVLGNFTEATDYLQESLKISEPAGLTLDVSYALLNLGDVLSEQGRYSEAQEKLLKALDLSRTTGDNVLAGTCYKDIGLVQFHQGDLIEASDYFKKGLKFFEAAGDQRGISSCLDNIGSVESFRGNHQGAIRYYLKSLDLAKSLGDKQHTAIILHNIGSAYAGADEYQTALGYYRRSLALRPAAEKPRIAEDLCDIAGIYWSERLYATAIQYASQAEEMASKIGKLETVADARTILGQAYRGLRDIKRARTQLAGAIEVVESLRSQVAGSEEDRQTFLSSRTAPYQEMASLLVEEHHPIEALGYAERAKARTLVEMLRPGRVKITGEMTATERQKERSLTARLNALNSQVISEESRSQPDLKRLARLKSELGGAQTDFDRFQTDLYTAHPELKAQRGEFQPITPNQIAALIDRTDMALLEYLVTKDKTYLFVLTGTEAGQSEPRIKVYELDIDSKALDALTRNFRRSLETRDMGFERQARALYNLLLKQAAPSLAGKKELVVVPDRALWEMPFQALESQRNHFLIQDYAISYAPSLTALREMSRPKSPGENPGAKSMELLAMGNPTIGRNTVEAVHERFRGERLDPLPWAQHEVETLGRLYGEPKSEVYVGADATEERLKAEAGRCRILHLAAHGIINDQNPMYSQIVLARAPDGKDDGVLEAWEIMNLNLRAELVVLSACDTAGGEVRAGEGMIGLTWAVFVAGCPTTVVSQWKVESASTEVLMIAFHRNLLAGKTKAQALREAELGLLKDPAYRHPFYWAPFVIIGDAN